MKTRSVIQLFFILLCTIHLYAGGRLTDDMESLLNNGKVLYSNGKYAEAVEVFTKVISKYPGDADLYIYRGSSSFKLQRYRDAADDLLKAGQLRPDDYSIDQSLAVIYSLMNDNKLYCHIEQSVIKGYKDFDKLNMMIPNENIRYSYEYYKFILNLKCKYKYRIKIDNSIPFQELLIDLKGSSLGMDNNHKSRMFQEERNRLAGSFENELWKFLGDDIGRYYWVSIYLEADCYLHGNKPLYELSLRIADKGIKLCESRNDVPGDIIGIAVTGVIVSYRINNLKLAKIYKDIAVKYQQKGDSYWGCFPAIDDEERKIYDSIK